MPAQLRRMTFGLSQNPIARAEFNHLQRSRRSRWARIANGTIAALLISFAVVPLFTYLQPESLEVWKLGAFAIFIYIAWIEIEIVSTSCNSIWRELDNHSWESLLVTGLSNQSFVLGKWCAVIQQKWKSIALLALLKLGIAYGFMQYLNIYPNWIDAEVNSFNRAFYYMSFRDFQATTPLAYYPNALTILASAFVLLVFSVADVSLVALTSLLAGLVFRRARVVGIMIPVLVRVALIVLGLASLSPIEDAVRTLAPSEPISYFYWGQCDSWWNPNDHPYIDYCHREENRRRLSESTQVAVSTLTDDGIALSANLMRPIGSFLFFLRNLWSAALGLMFFLLLSWLYLNMTLLVATRHGMSRPEYKKE